MKFDQGDEIRASAIRRIVSESSTGSTDSKRIHLMLTIRVNKIQFSAHGIQSADAIGAVAKPPREPSASTSSAGSSTLHVSGPITSESENAKMGAFHTLDLEAGRIFTLIKQEDGWDSVGIERMQEATNLSGSAEVGAVVCGEGIEC